MRYIKLIAFLIICVLLPLDKSLAFGRQDLSGTWFHDNQPVSITHQFHRNYLFCNEQNDCANGFMNFPGNIVVPQWQVNGSIQGGGNSIYWSNNTVWTRSNFPPFGPGPFPPVFNPMMLNGQWTHDGQATFITVYGNGQLTITNEQQQTFPGYLNSARVIFIPSLGIQGMINHRGNLIRWNNNTVWTR
jgi:hypothetical protein